jgi:LPS export ABC transporter protein LptC
VILGVSMLFSCQKNDIEVINTITGLTSLPDQTARDIETVYTDSGRVQLILQAPELLRFANVEEPYIEFPWGINVEFYNGMDLKQSSLDANYAIYYEDRELWEARNNVVAVNEDGDVLNTELLFWDEGKRLIYSDNYVKITTLNEVIFGEGFEANQDFSDWRIKKVTGTIYIDNE